MPSVSDRQRRYLYHKFGPDWVKAHHFDKVDKSKKKRKSSIDLDEIERRLRAR